MYNIYYTEVVQLNEFIGRLKDKFNVFTPVINPQNFTGEIDYSYKKFDQSKTFLFNPYRVVEPLKAFFLHPSEKVSGYFASSGAAAAAAAEEKTADLGKAIIFGIKSCDLAAHKIQDFVFLEGIEVDSLYRVRRENTIFISGDCSDIKEVCHCLSWDILPYPAGGFDLNLSPLNEGYVVEVGSNRGEELIKEYKEYFSLAKDVQISGRQAKRQSLIERLKRHLLPKNLVHKDTVQQLVRDGYNLDTWQQFMLTCVECGGCNFICDTCHCFLLSDTKTDSINTKNRIWDSCQYANYARVAGGANPLKFRAQRLRFRYTKKFDFFTDNLGVPACCGCGRCIEACPGKIDIREVLKDLAKKLISQ
ncbi:MAG: 4Fe-4S dicluster domain-containing protein [Candidatus Omnitrophota bacterium]